MKKILLLALLALAPLCALAQTTVTPHIGLEVPSYGSSNWQVPLGFSLNRLDQLLSGNATLPGLTLSGPIVLSGPPTLSTQAATKAYVDAVAGSGNATQIQGSPISATAPTSGQFFGWNGTSWGPVTVNAANATSLQSIPIAATAPNDGQALTYQASTNSYLPATVGGGSQRIVYTSKLLGTFGDATVAPGSSAAGATDRAAAINAALAGGNVRLVIDGQYGLMSTLNVYSNTQVSCLPGMGLIMMPAANTQMWANAHQNAATTADTTGGFFVSNLTDHDIDIGGDGHCTFNLNSTESASSSDHKTNGSSPLWLTGTRFLGISNLHVAAHWYDSPTYTVLYSNIEHARIGPNWVQLPSIIPGKNTDGIHGNGPLDDIRVSDTHCTNNADDCVAFNADDGNESKFGDGNAPHVQFPGWQQGPITNGAIEHTFMDDGYNEIRLLSVTERIDNVNITDTKGTSEANAGTLYHEYGYALGNFGNIKVSDFSVTETGSQAGRPAYIYAGGNFDSLTVNGFALSNPTSNFAPLRIVDGTIGNLSASDWTIFDPTGIDINLVVSAASIQGLKINGINWYTSGAYVGTVVSGTAPAVLNVSSYTGPSARIIPSSGYTPGTSIGDAFGGSTPPPTSQATVVPPAGATVYMQSLFNEHASGTLLVGTTPAITTASASWVNYASGTPTFEYLGGALNSGGSTSNNFVGINTGAANETVRVLNTSGFGGNQVALRFTDGNNFVAVVLDPGGSGSATVYNVVGGGAGTVCALAAGGNGSGLMTAVLSGASMTLTYNGVTTSCSIPSNTSGTGAGFNIYTGSANVIITGMSAASN